jgi:transposase
VAVIRSQRTAGEEGRRLPVAAPCVFDGPINGRAFLAWTEQALAPTLQPGDIVVLDNPSSHPVGCADITPWDPACGRMADGIKAAVEARGAKLAYLPPYSPDLNPIEQVFAKLEHLLRKAAARTVDALHDAIAQLLETFTPQECANYLIDSGYVPANRETL